MSRNTMLRRVPLSEINSNEATLVREDVNITYEHILDPSTESIVNSYLAANPQIRAYVDAVMSDANLSSGLSAVTSDHPNPPVGSVFYNQQSGTLHIQTTPDRSEEIGAAPATGIERVILREVPAPMSVEEIKIRALEREIETLKETVNELSKLLNNHMAEHHSRPAARKLTLIRRSEKC